MPEIKLKSEYKDLDKYEDCNGNIRYYKKNTDILHNPYCYAVICKDGYIAYLIEGLFHRLDGPAVIWDDGDEDYYIHNKFLTKEEFEVHPEKLKYLGKEHLICLK